ncbi:hypothetical protein VTK26DRAFT_510 [Humicola hyalothermophila]
MAWGRDKSQPAPLPIRQLLPLLITLVVLGGIAWVCYLVYVSLGKIKAQARKQMGDNVVISREGVRLTVKNIGNESYVDRTQRWVVKAWNLGTDPSNTGSEESSTRKRNVLTKQKPSSESDSG